MGFTQLAPVMSMVSVMVYVTCTVLIAAYFLFGPERDERRDKMGIQNIGNLKDNTVDTNSGLEIRLTDNSPKEEDIFKEDDQFNRPLTEEEIAARIEEATAE